MQQQFDVIVVGAGPAGSMAAIHLADKGLKVAILEKGTFPRIKTCGDLVTMEGLDLLKDAGLESWMNRCRRVDDLRFISPAGDVLDVAVCNKQAEARNRIIPRETLDSKLAEAAVKRGAQLYEGCRVNNAVITDHGVKAITDRTIFNAAFILLADGSHAPVTRKMGLLNEPPDLMAARQYLSCPAVDPCGPLEFHFQKDILPGYIWLFPEGNGIVNIGAGTYTRRVRKKEVNLLSFLASSSAHDTLFGVRLKDARALGPVKFHPLRTNINGTQTHSNRCMVLGDAAGLVSPLTGEGIASGLFSGALAAQVLLRVFREGSTGSAALAEYTKTLHRRFRRDHQAAYLLRSSLRKPLLLNRFFRAMLKDEAMAHLFAMCYLDEKSPQLLLGLRNLLKIAYQ